MSHLTRRRSILFDNTPSKLAKGQPGLQIDDLIEIRLREDGKRVPRNAGVPVRHVPGLHALDEVRHRFEPSLRDQLQCLARLERQAVPWDRHFVDLARPRQDVQARRRVWG